jgi:hypothetical protein
VKGKYQGQGYKVIIQIYIKVKSHLTEYKTILNIYDILDFHYFYVSIAIFLNFTLNSILIGSSVSIDKCL